MAIIKFNLRDKHAILKTLIRMSVTFGGERILICTKNSIHPSEWDFDSGLPNSTKPYSNGDKIRKSLGKLKVDTEEIFDELSKNGKVKVDSFELKRKIQNLINPEKYVLGEIINKKFLIDFMDDFIADCENGKRLHKKERTKLAYATIQTFKTTRFHFLNFEKTLKKRILLADFNQSIHDKFLDYLELELKISLNATSKQMQNLKLIIEYAIDKKLIPKFVQYETSFETRREETDHIFLDENELQLLINFNDIKCEEEQIVLDMFLIGSYTGLRFGNYSKFNLDFLQNGLYSTHQNKGLKEKVLIPIHPIVYNIIEKYNNKMPVCPSNTTFNKVIKNIASRIPEFNVPFSKIITKNRDKIEIIKPKSLWICSHTCRRNFCSNMYLRGIPVETIMAISGHKTHKNFIKYMKASSIQHAKIMKDFWDK